MTTPTAQAIKRVLDISLASILLLLLSPVIAAVALTIFVTSGRPILFRQLRPGLHGRPFLLCKFRTMRAPLPGEQRWTTDDVRSTRIGRFLRRTSLDELPELVQVVTGRMSLVGPRPLLMEYLPRYNARHARRHVMKPGITGLAQVSGRRSLTLGQRLDLDIDYIDNWSLRLDLRILVRTLGEPFRRGEIRGQSLTEVDDVGLLVPTLERSE
ncbi:Sugar transferase involved in LPS biosynthesis (colanic, teichoic acid) [Micromonospora rhizosphaerae]|uniref:Sugar transferase involved in LPS biosynthesis (Colanic, teichoic acid) n=1 Tax=Micromonospora rhizosphaerae TaxID=568872 RepID=A0A1C6S3M2_9ACTN|nr:sugar transferase [Micromonospora rhizosphaerae]SCL24031.1 Sugar transferase involved in LPS biosynthesis (colanic, teichoic acid) [Micromonospora rhizosphaerae]